MSVNVRNKKVDINRIREAAKDVHVRIHDLPATMENTLALLGISILQMKMNGVQKGRTMLNKVKAAGIVGLVLSGVQRPDPATVAELVAEHQDKKH